MLDFKLATFYCIIIVYTDGGITIPESYFEMVVITIYLYLTSFCRKFNPLRKFHIVSTRYHCTCQKSNYGK